MLTRRFLLSLMLVLVCNQWVAAQTTAVPSLVYYEGTVTDSEGKPIPSGTKTLYFTIYDKPTYGNTIWGPQKLTKVPIVDGFFSVVLSIDSDGSSITEAFDSRERYMGIRVGSQPEISPRRRISSIPYALQSQNSVHAVQSDNSTHAVQSDNSAHAVQSDNSKLFNGLTTSSFAKACEGGCGKVEKFPGDGFWGTWYAYQECPARHYVCAISVRIEGSLGSGDDTGMNGLRFKCCPLD
jgi:hypothetical protein